MLIICLALLALGALPAGWSLITQPDGRGIGLPLEWLDRSPFQNFVIPGLFLFLLFGMGSLVVIYGLLARPRWAWTESLTRRFNMHWSLMAAALIGFGQMIWIVVELLMTQRFFLLQPICFGIGLAILALSLAPGMRRQYKLVEAM